MQRRVLFGVLNWGLGHATRSSVLVKALLAQDIEVILASDGIAGAWLQTEFPHLQFLELPDYGVRYSKSNKQWPRLLASLGPIAWAAHKERQSAEMWAEEYEVSAVISDNRLGFRSRNHKSIYLSHQFRPQAGNFSSLAAMAHRAYYHRFDELWLPDRADAALSGDLSMSPRPVVPIGILSALENAPTERNIPVLIILSGPEPQRSILEAKLMDHSALFPEGSVLVRGTDGACPDRYKKRFKIYDRLGSFDLSRLISAADIVISRSGYSSLMDYRKLGKKALLIPTPGQYEQEYLAKKHSGNYGWLMAEQDNLQLERNLDRLKELPQPEAWELSLPPDLFKPFLG